MTESSQVIGRRDGIKGLCFDTAASNTGVYSGTCILVENAIGRELLNLACRQHVSELMLKKVFELNDISKSPVTVMELFSRFKDFWPQIMKSEYSTATEDNLIMER